MECFTIRGLTFAYPDQGKKILDGLSFSIEQGEFITLAGPSGCGKTTLLRQFKSVLSPHGSLSGEIYFEGRLLQDIDQREQSARIGFVMQNPDNQIVTDKVWHELAFGLESLGYDTPTIRGLVAEMTSFFGMQTWFYKNVYELSGGQKQLLNLASAMALQPSVLILDEPTSQLDPIAAGDFLAAVGKINRELGTTIIITEHRLEEVLPMSDRVLVMDAGRLICDDTPGKVGERLKERGHSMFLSMPAPMRIYAAVDNKQQCPITVHEGRIWLDAFAEKHRLSATDDSGMDGMQRPSTDGAPIVELDDVWFKYEEDSPNVIKGLSMKAYKGEFLAILGGNGTGKTTVLSLIAGINKPHYGTVILEGEEIKTYEGRLFKGFLGVLPQSPQTLFVKKTVRGDLLEILRKSKLSKEEKERKIAKVSRLCRLEELLTRHPYDLSGGEQQRAAFAKVLLLDPKVLLLDEPTKGLDAEFKQIFAGILKRLLSRGVTIIMVSHDIEFCAKYAHRCAMFFDGAVVAEDKPNVFFTNNSFYTTTTNRMARHLIPNAVTADNVICACGGHLPDPQGLPSEDVNFSPPFDFEQHEEVQQKLPLWRKFIAMATGKNDRPIEQEQVPVGKRKLSKRTIVAAVMILLAIPMTIYSGIFYFGDRKYYFISLLIILETMIPFFLIFEGRKPQARELIVISALCAIGVAGRAAFFMLPQFKPIAAIVIISGVAFGGEAGFLVGAITMMVSNMMFGQGPWTPWQMFAMGLIGFLAGILFRKGLLRRSRLPLCIFGGFVTIVVYGGLMNPSFVIMYQQNPTWSMFLMAYLNGFPFDLVHSAATVIFLWLISRPMLEKLDRIKVKYGLME